MINALKNSLVSFKKYNIGLILLCFNAHVKCYIKKKIEIFLKIILLLIIISSNILTPVKIQDCVIKNIK